MSSILPDENITKKRKLDDITEKKTKRLYNKLYESDMNPPKMANEIIPLGGTIMFSCPSTDTFSKHIVSVSSITSGLNFECNCDNAYGNKYNNSIIKSKSCCHINAVMIYIKNQYITKAINFDISKNNYLETKQNINKISHMLEKL